MQMSDFLQTYTGLTTQQLFGGNPPLVALAQDGDGVVTITQWGITTVSKPTPAAIAKALAAPNQGPTVSFLITYAQNAQQAVLAKGQTFNVAASGATPVQVLCDGLQSTRSDLALLALYGQTNPTGTKTWIDNQGIATVLSGNQLVQLATLAGNWISDTYPALLDLIGQISAKSPTVTTTSQIDSYSWPTV